MSLEWSAWFLGYFFMSTKQTGSRIKFLSSSWHAILACQWTTNRTIMQISKVLEIFFPFIESLLCFSLYGKIFVLKDCQSNCTHGLYKSLLLLDSIPHPHPPPPSVFICKFMNRTSPRFLNWHLGTPPEVTSGLGIFGNRFCRTVGQGEPHKRATIWNRYHLKRKLR